MTIPTIVPITDLDAIRAAGVHYPETVDGWRWLYRQRAERRLEHVFPRLGRRVMVDIPAYVEALRQQAEAGK